MSEDLITNEKCVMHQLTKVLSNNSFTSQVRGGVYVQ
jgi:hypothetical protein